MNIADAPARKSPFMAQRDGRASGLQRASLKNGSPRRSQLDSGFIERGILQVKRLRRSPVIVLLPWNAVSDAKPVREPAPRVRRDPLKLARHYQSLMDSGKFESRAALARYLGVSRARVTQVLRRLKEVPL